MCMYYEDQIPLRLAKLRLQKNVSAREMSLSIGQNASYINNIETGKALPSLSAFFFICEYLNITPSEFFEEENPNPERLRNLMADLKQLDDAQLSLVESLVKNLIKK